MQHEKETRPSLQAKGRESVSNREVIIAQRRVDLTGIGWGLALAALMAYIALCETGVIA